MMNHESNSNEKQDDLQAELVAYLDDELDNERRHQIDDLLTRIPAVRDSVAGLGRAWDALDYLPRSEVDESFTKSTVEMIAVQAASDVRQQQDAAPGRKRRGILTAAAVVAGMLLLGFAVALLWPDENDRLLADLPVVHDLDAYARTPGIAFLRQLDKPELFAASPESEGVAETGNYLSSESYADRQAAIDAMEPDEKSLLLRKWERFQRLDRAERDRMRQLHAAIHGDPRLRQVMQEYGRWLSELNPLDRDELTKLDAHSRLARVEQLRAEDALRFDPHDMPALHRWLLEFVENHRERLLDSIPRDRRRWFEDRHRRHDRRLMLGWALVFNKELRELLQAPDIEQLRQQLRPDGQAKLDNAADLDAQRDLIVGWIEIALRQGKKDRYNVTQEQLVEFLEQLNNQTRDELLRLPAGEMLERLRAMYFHHQRDAGQGFRGNGDHRQHSRDSADGPPRRGHDSSTSTNGADDQNSDGN